MIMLSGLYPGVGYNCSLVARNAAGPSDPAYTNDTTQETGVYMYLDVHKCTLFCAAVFQAAWPSASQLQLPESASIGVLCHTKTYCMV